MSIPVGPNAQLALKRLENTWRQGEHIVVSGPTGSGKTTLARHLLKIRTANKGYCIALVCKLRPDPTILDEYRGWDRWEQWRKRGPYRGQREILLWPNLSGMPPTKALRVQRDIFREALDAISMRGNFTVQYDDALYLTAPEFLNLKPELAMSHAMGRSSGITNVVLTQRPAHIPLIIYGSASHAFVGRTRELTDLRRLQELGGRESSREMGRQLSGLDRREFLWVPVAPDWQPEIVDLAK